MGAELDGMMLVRAELRGKVEALQRLSSVRRSREFSDTLVGIRRLAAAYGLTPVVRLSESFERVAGRGRCVNSLYFDRLYDAIGCDRCDDQASESMIASVSVRLC